MTKMTGTGNSARLTTIKGYKSSILSRASDFVFQLFKDNYDEKYVYHNFIHTRETVNNSEKIAKRYDLTEEQYELLILAAWFHDTGYYRSYENHEQESAEIAREFLRQENYPEEKVYDVTRLVLFTSWEEPPSTPVEEILHDADYLNIGNKDFFRRAQFLRMEWETFLDKKFTDIQWEEFQLDFLLKTDFYTDYAIKKYGEARRKNIEEQRKIVAKKKEEAVKNADPRRGVETMYRTTYRNHINLSSIADSKANMMISINTIIMTVIITVIGSGFTFTGKSFYEHIRFTIPICILLISSLFSVIFAVLSARPLVTHKLVNLARIRKNKSSVLFFGNFTHMQLSEFLENVRELRNQKETLYDNMTIDLYFLGKVLTRKYILLRISYGVFMVGLILCVLSFLTIFLTYYSEGG